MQDFLLIRAIPKCSRDVNMSCLLYLHALMQHCTALQNYCYLTCKTYTDIPALSTSLLYWSYLRVGLVPQVNLW